jgi:transaldolase
MSANLSSAFDTAVVELGTPPGRPAQPRLSSNPLLAAVCRAGTRHIFADTADVDELRATITAADGTIFSEVDGNTANQPLVRKVLARYLAQSDVAAWEAQLRGLAPDVTDADLAPVLYAIVCGHIGLDAARTFGAGRAWEVSLQIHMGLAGDPDAARRIGRYLRRVVPSAVVKVPFTPHAPHCFLVARDLELEGIPVNFTSTFSARQAVAAALLSNVTLTNIFMGRLNQGLHAALLGEHVDLCAQRALTRVRREAGVKTQLIVASVREWQTFVRVAGCDAFTAPCDSIRGLLAQKEIAPEQIMSQLETSYEDRLGIAPEIASALGTDRIARTYVVEPEFVDFLVALRRSAEYRAMRDGDQLVRRFEEAGFADFFYAPAAAEWTELRKNKLPDVASPLTARLPLDTLYTLLADADFDKFQEEMDAMITERRGG